jgi:hypothetical protein
VTSSNGGAAYLFTRIKFNHIILFYNDNTRFILVWFLRSLCTQRHIQHSESKLLTSTIVFGMVDRCSPEDVRNGFHLDSIAKIQVSSPHFCTALKMLSVFVSGSRKLYRDLQQLEN